MCDIASRIVTPDGIVVFLTDDDAEKAIADGRLASWEDACGHSAIRVLYPGIGRVEEDELFPAPPEYVRALREGKLRRILAAQGVSALYLADDGWPHREDGPAIVRTTGTREWYRNGLLHREDGPAIERADGTREWYRSGQRHRTDGPAVEWADGACQWWVDGIRRPDPE